MKFEDGKIFPLFSIPLLQLHATDYVNDVIDLNNIPYEEFYNNRSQQYTMNSLDQNILLDERFKNIKDIIDAGVAEYVYGQLKIPPTINLKLVCSWMLLGFPGCITSTHMHTNSMFSGVFYIKSEENCGNIVFTPYQSQMTYTTPTVRPYPTEYNIFNSLTWTVTPKTNDLLVFPSHLQHEVTENVSDTVRCAIAFNYFLTGDICDVVTRTLNI
jgi:hypothetical protein